MLAAGPDSLSLLCLLTRLLLLVLVPRVQVRGERRLAERGSPGVLRRTPAWVRVARSWWLERNHHSHALAFHLGRGFNNETLAQHKAYLLQYISAQVRMGHLAPLKLDSQFDLVTLVQEATHHPGLGFNVMVVYFGA